MFRNRQGIGCLASIVLTIALIGAIAAFLTVRTGSTTSSASGSSQTTKAPAAAMVQIPKGQGLFAPFIQTVQIGTTVTWQNQDNTMHTISTTWDHSSFLNPEPFSLVLPASSSGHFTFTEAGIYDYFDTAAATWNTTTHRVAANKGSANFPLAMEGIVWVQGPISGVSSTATEMIPGGQDDFVTEFLAITTGGSVTWHNGDTDTHFVALVPDWSTPINPVRVGVLTIAGTTTVKGGATQAITFNKPGLYYYYCPTHAAINTQWRRAQANTDASIYPTPMGGFVLVVS